MIRLALALAVLFLAAACAGSGGGWPGRVESGARDEEPGSPPPPVAYGGEILRLGAEDLGYQRPQLDDGRCLAEALRKAPAAAGVENKVRFAVLRDGSLARFSYLSPVTDEQARSIEAAFSSCRWNPGLDRAGHPVAVWVIQPIKVLAAQPSGYP